MKRYLMICVCVICLVSLSSSSNAQKKPVIGFIPMTITSEYFMTMVNAAKLEAEKEGVELLVHSARTYGNVVEQIDIIEEMIEKQVDAICIVPSSSAGIIASLVKAGQSGIALINLDTRIDPDVVETAGLSPIPFIGTNNYKGAASVAAYAREHLQMRGKNVALLNGIAEHQNARDRRNGFCDALTDEIRIVAEGAANWEMDEGYSVFSEVLLLHPEIEMLFAGNDNMALGSIWALQEAGRDDVEVIGYDAVGSALDAIEAGTMLATVAQFPAEMGIKGVQLALKKIRGETVPDAIFTKTEVIDASNVGEFRHYLQQYQ